MRAIIVLMLLLAIAGCGRPPAVNARKINHGCTLERRPDGKIALISPAGIEVCKGNRDDWQKMIEAATSLFNEPAEE